MGVSLGPWVYGGPDGWALGIGLMLASSQPSTRARDDLREDNSTIDFKDQEAKSYARIHGTSL